MKEISNHQHNSCEKKTAYSNWQEAEEACLRVMDESKRELIMAYKCMFEDHWHFGHNPSISQSKIFSKERSRWLAARMPKNQTS